MGTLTHVSERFAVCRDPFARQKCTVIKAAVDSGFEDRFQLSCRVFLGIRQPGVKRSERALIEATQAARPAINVILNPVNPDIHIGFGRLNNRR